MKEHYTTKLKIVRVLLLLFFYYNLKNNANTTSSRMANPPRVHTYTSTCRQIFSGCYKYIIGCSATITNTFIKQSPVGNIIYLGAFRLEISHRLL